MFRKAIISLYLLFLCCTGNYATEVSWEVGLTEERKLITAEGVINNESNATVLYLSGLDGNESKNNNLDELVPAYAEVAGPNDINLIVISRANPEGNQLQFPPAGQAYTENTVSHVLWRWIGSHAPDLIIIEPDDDFGFREAITRTSKAEAKFIRQTGGHGQYGHVWIEVEPLERGSGYVFENVIKGGAIPQEYIPSVSQGAKEALSSGLIGGYPVVDVKVILLDGSYHDVDSSKVAFQIAGSMAMKTALGKAKSILLEPIMSLQVITPEESMGDVIGDLGKRRANIKNIEAETGTQYINASLPLGESFGYANTLRSLTQGRASYNMEFDQYEQAPSHLVESQ